MDLQLNGRRAAVAAASSGLGRSVAARLAAEGASVAVCSHDPDRLARAVSDIPGDVLPLVHDLDSWEAGSAFIDAAWAALGGLDVVVVNHPGPPVREAANLSHADVLGALDRSLFPALAMCTRAIPLMRRQSWGRIVVITSLTAREPIPGLALSTLARTAVTGFVKSLADEVAADGITVNTIQPGYHNTARVDPRFSEQLVGQIPAGHLGDPDDLATAVAYLCSASASYITGTSLLVDGGLHRGL